METTITKPKINILVILMLARGGMHLLRPEEVPKKLVIFENNYFILETFAVTDNGLSLTYNEIVPSTLEREKRT